MKKENVIIPNIREPTMRMTRARAATYQSSGVTRCSVVSKQQDQKQGLQKNGKRAALDENYIGAPVTANVQHKRRAVLKDVTNVCCKNSYTNCLNAANIPRKNGKKAKKGSVDMLKVDIQQLPAVSETKLADEIRNTELQPAAHCQLSTENSGEECGIGIPQLEKQQSRLTWKSQSFSKKVSHYGKSIISTKPDFIDIDSDDKDPQLCCVYALDIYSNLRVAELMRRPDSNSMETIQRDITRSMRGILVDWIVEVCEEYKLVPDTLYLTVYLIDLFLSRYFIERQRLQLLGITCMLIASKYEEICAPRAEEFCFITDNTYTKPEVLKMESKILNYLGFQLSAPTAKSFLRRFLRAAQASYTCPSLELEFLANYLAELTLVDYSFLKFMPSIIAASAVFLARWTLDQSRHPWNSTLEHYTNYKSSDLKTAVLALQSLQLNTDNCPLNAIRGKYRLDKFKSVAALSSPKVLETLF